MSVVRSTLPVFYRAPLNRMQLLRTRSGPAARPSPNQLVDGRAGAWEDSNGLSSYEMKSKKKQA